MGKQRFPNLRKAMKASKESVNKLAKEIRLTPWCLERRLYGQVCWTLDEIKLVCNHYHLTFEYLFYE